MITKHSPVIDPLIYLNSKERVELLATRDRVIGSGVPFKRTLLESIFNSSRFSEQLIRATQPYGLDQAAHLVNGLGNYRSGSETGLSKLFSNPTRSGKKVFIPQNAGDRNSDYHPWQSFAYCAMAGIKPDEYLPALDVTMKDLAIKSNRINLSASGDNDLGHLLFAASYLVPDPKFKFIISGEKLPLSDAFRNAYEASTEPIGTLSVCSGYHLIEGMCAASSLVPGLSAYHEDVQALLDIKTTRIYMDVSKLYTTVESDFNPASTHYLKYNLFHVGHMGEMASFARFHGYTIKPEVINCLNFCWNTLGPLYSNHIHHGFTSFLAHFRRGITLHTAMEDLSAQGKNPKETDLSSYTSIF